MEILRVVKMLYLADYLYAKTFGNREGFTGIYTRYEHGPVPQKFYDNYNQLLQDGTIHRNGNILESNTRIPSDALTEQEIACLDKILNDFSSTSINKLLKVAYATEPMEKIIEKETQMGVNRALLWADINFDEIHLHPLMDNADIDTSFMDSPEFSKTLDD